MSQQLVITKLVIETQSPMAIYTGKRETGFDNQLARDINGLPYIPASSIAGVWSHLTQEFISEAFKNHWFGDCNQSASLSISHGQLLDSRQQRVERFCLPTRIAEDELLKRCANARPHHRDRVAINDRGVAKDKAKFDQLLLPAGLRFEVQFTWHSRTNQAAQQEQQQWLELLNLWQHPRFAFGSSTRNGLGRIAIVHSEQAVFELTDGASLAEKISQFRSKAVPQVHQLKKQLEQTQAIVTAYADIQLQALDNWRCGSGVELLTPPSSASSSQTAQSDASFTEHVGIISYSEPKFVWQNNRASLVDNQPVLCGSSIKGILAHRIAYHLRRHLGQWAHTLADADHDTWQQRPEQLKELLGIADPKNHAGSLAGILFVEDSPIEYQHTVLRTHNSIDRFTGGVRQGALYREQLLYQPKFHVRLHLSRELTTLPNELQQALKDTLEDLKTGLLPMGAGSGRGNSLVMAVA